MKRLLTGCALLLTAGAAGAQVMECYDAKGTKTIAQFCPSGTVKENKLMKGGAGPGPATAPSTPAAPAGTASAPAKGKTLAEQDAEFKKRTLERQDAEKKSEKEKSDAKDVERNCLDARSQLRALQDGQRISRTDPKTGERTVLEDKDRAAEIATAQRSADQWCNKK
jgi:hypothetical protein